MERFSWHRWVRSLSTRNARASRLPRPLSLEFLESRETPALFTWDAGGSDNKWSNRFNWVGDVAPNPNNFDDLNFPAGAARLNAVNDFTNGLFNSITIGGTGYLLSGASLTLGSSASASSGSVTVNAGVTNATISLDVTLAKASGTNHDFSIGSGATLNFTGQIKGTTGAGIAKVQAGVLIFASSNSEFAGAISVNAGVLQVGNSMALGTTSARTTVASNAQLQILSGVGTINEPLTLNGPGLGASGGLLNVASNNTWAGAITLDADSTIGSSAGTLNIDGIIGDSAQGYSIVKEGAGTVVLRAANTYRGTTTINNGVLSITNALALGLADGLDSSRTIVNQSIGKAGTLRIDPGAGGTLVVENELLELNGDGFGGLGSLQSATGNNAWTGNVYLGSPAPNNSAVTIRVNDPTTTTLPMPSLTIGSGGPYGVTGDGIISTPYTSNGLTKTGQGTLILTSSNTFTSAVTVATGVLQISDSQALGQGGTGSSFNSSGADSNLPVPPVGDGSATATYPTLPALTNNNVAASAINVTGVGTITNLMVNVRISHTFSGDIRLRLVAPDLLTTVQLVKNSYGSFAVNGYLNTTFDDTASIDIATAVAPFGRVRPDSPLSAFNGLSADGTWYLQVMDAASGNVGTLESWSLSFNTTGAGAGTSVSTGAALWLALDELPDSITNTTNTLKINETLSLSGVGVNGTGALRSVTGQNLIESNISLAARTAIGVDADPNANSTNQYFNTDYKLTHTGDLTGGVLLKVRAGQLVFPEANTKYSSDIEIKEGWITITDSLSLGALRSPNKNNDASITQNNEALVTIDKGAALHLRPDQINEQLVINQNFRISGTGITHPYTQDGTTGTGGISQNGAILNLNGIARFNGNIVQNERAGVGSVLLNPNSFPAGQVYAAGDLRDAPRLMRVDESSGGLELEHSTIIPVLGKSGTLTITLDTKGMLSPDNIRIYYGPRGTAGSRLLYDSGSGSYGVVTISTTFNSFSATTTVPNAAVLFQNWNAGSTVVYPELNPGAIEIVINEGTTTVARTWDFQAILQENEINAGLVKLGDQAVVLQGNGSYEDDVEVNEGVLVLQNSTALGLGNGSKTTVAEGATLALGTTIAGNNGGTVAGLAIFGERLILNGRGSNTLLQPNNAGSVLDTSYKQTRVGQLAALVSLANADFLNGTGTLLEPTFADIIAADHRLAGTVGLNASSAIDTQTGTRLSIVAPIDDGANSATAGSSLIKIGTGELRLAGANTYRGVTYVGTSATDNPTVSGQLFNQAMSGGPNTPLAGGILTVANSLALGQGTNLAGDGTIVQSGSALQLEGNITIAGERLTVSGSGVTSSATTSSPGVIGLHQMGPSPVNNTPTLQTGPTTTAGRVNAVSIHPADPNTIYITTPGGLWKTTDNGKIWTPLFDNQTNTPIFSNAILIDSRNGQHIYFASGESNNTQDSFAGTGIYETIDGGRTWSLLVDSDTLFTGLTVTKMVQDPVEPDIIYVATGDLQTNGRSNTNNVGVWRFDLTSTAPGTQWKNLTARVSTARTTAASAPNTPGPDDDFSIDFPQNNAAWTDLAVTTTDERNSFGNPYRRTNQSPVFTHTVLHASLGTYRGDRRYPPPTGGTFTRPTAGAGLFINAVYRLDNPSLNSNFVVPVTLANENLRWYVGGGFLNYSTLPLVPSGINAPNDSYPSSVNNNQYFAGNIQLHALGTGRSSTRVIATVSEGTDYNFDNGGFVVTRSNPANPGPTQNRLAIYKSTEGYNTAVTWGRVTLPPEYMGNYGHYAQAFLMINTTTMFVGGRLGIYRSDNVSSAAGSETWTLISPASMNGAAVQSFTSSPGDNSLIAATDAGIFKYNLGTNTWTSINGNLANTIANGVAINPNDPSSIIAGLQTGGIVQTNNSNTWTRVDTANNRTFGGQVAIDPTNPLVMYAFEQNGPANLPGRGGNPGGVLRKSTDGGTTWFNTGFASFGGGNNFQGVNPTLRIDPVNPNRLIVVEDQYTTDYSARPIIPSNRVTAFYESLDGGASFLSLGTTMIGPSGISNDIQAIPGRGNSGSMAGFQGDFVFDPGFPQVVDAGANTPDTATYVYTNGVDIRVTKNRGTSWVTRNLPVAGNVGEVLIDPRNRDTMYAIRNVVDSNSVIFKTTDAGQTWTSLMGVGNTALPMNMAAWSLAVDPRDGTIYLGTDRGLYFAANGQESWGEVGIGLPNVLVRQVLLDTVSNTLTLATNGRGVFQTWLNKEANQAGVLRAVSGSAVWTGDVVLNGNTSIGSDGTQQLRGYTNAQLNILGRIVDAAGTSNNTVTKLGAGSVTFSGANTYTGQTLIQEGVVVSNNSSALGSVAGNTVVSSGAALELINSVGNEPLILNGNGSPFGFNGHNTGALRSVANANTYSGPITLATDSTVGVDSGSSLIISGSIGGPSKLTKELTGTLTLAAANTYVGDTNVQQGALRVANSAALGSTAAPTVILDGAQVLIGSLDTPATPLTIAEPFRLSGTGINATGSLVNIAGNNTLTGTVELGVNPGFLPTPVPSGVVSIGVTASTQLTLSGSVINRVSSEIPSQTVASGLTKVNTGTLVLSGSNTYSGTTTVAQGILQAASPTALGTPNRSAIQRVLTSATNPGPTSTFTLSLLGETTAAIAYNASETSVRLALEALTSIAPGDVSVTRDTVTVETTAGNRLTVVYTITFASGFNAPSTPITLAFAGGVTGSAVVVATPNVGTLVNNGATLQVNLNNGTITDEALTLNGAGVDGIGALHNLAGNNTWAGSVLNVTPITLATSSSIGVAAGSLTVSTGINGPTSSTLTKTGPGTLLFPTVNNYGGTTQVVGGILNVSNAGALGTATTNEVQRVTLSGARSGSFTLTFKPNAAASGEQTASLRVDAINAASVQTALENLASIAPGDVSVSRVGTSDVYLITFTGQYAGRDLPQLTGTATTGTGVAFATITQGGVGSTIVSSGATLQLAGDTSFTQESVTLNGAGANGIGALDSANGQNSWSGGVTLAMDASIGAQNASRTIINTPIAQVSAGTNLTKVGAGAVQFTGMTSNAYTGTTTVNDGTLELNKSGSAVAIPGNILIGDAVGLDQTAVLKLLASDQIINASAITIRSDGLFDANDRSETVASFNIVGGRVLVGSLVSTAGVVTATTSLTMTGGNLNTGTAGDRFVLSGAAPITAAANSSGPALIDGLGLFDLGTSNHTVTTSKAVVDQPDLVIDALISSTATTALTKQGPGTLALDADNSSTLTGQVSVTAGSLQVGGTVGSVSLTGGNGTVSGEGTVNRIYGTSPGIAPSGTIAPGNNLEFNSEGTLTLAPNGLTTWGPSTTLFLDLTDPAFPGRPAGYDQLVLSSGSLDLAGASLNGLVDGLVALGNSFTILRAINGASLIGKFAHNTDGTNDVVFVGGAKFFMTTTNGSNGTVVLTRTINTTKTSLVSSITPSIYGQGNGILFTASVSPGTGDEAAGAPPTTTSVRFELYNSTNAIIYSETLPVDASGKAVFNPQFALGSALAVGTYSARAFFLGSDTFQASQSTLITQNVTKGDTTFTMTGITSSGSSVGTVSVVSGQSLDVRVSVNPKTPAGVLLGSLRPGGSVVFFVDGVAQPPQTLDVNGESLINAGVLSVGTHTVDVQYFGDNNYNGIQTTSATRLFVTVRKGTIAFAVNATPSPAVFGETVNLTATLNPNSPSSVVPTGSVSFYLGTPTATGNLLGTASISGTGIATFTPTTAQLPVGSYVIRAIYAGDANYSPPATVQTTLNVTLVGSTTVLSSSANPAAPGQTVTLSAAVTRNTGSGVATGQVRFMNIGTGAILGTIALNTSGVASLNVNLPAGTTNIRADYLGSPTLSGSTTTLSQLVAYASRTALTTSNNPSLPGTIVTFTASVSRGTGVAGTIAAPVGSVAFFDDSVSTTVPAFTGTINAAGVASWTTSALAQGIRPIRAVFTSTNNYATSNATLSQSVVFGSTTTLVGPGAPIVTGQSAQFTASVVGGVGGSGPATGEVQFLVGSVVLGTATLNSSGQATFTATTLIPANTVVTARYVGDNQYGPSQGTTSVVVNKAMSSVQLDAARTSGGFGQVATFTATLSAVAPGSGLPGGTVTFQASPTSGTPISSGALAIDANTGKATWNVSTLPRGTYTIRAVYSGNASYLNSTSNPVSFTVLNAATTTVTTSQNPATPGQSITLTARVQATTGTPSGSGLPSGQVVFVVDGVDVGTASLAFNAGVGTATFVLPPGVLSLGSHTVVVRYAPDGASTFGESVSATLTQAIKGNTTTSLTTSAASVVQGQNVTFTATVGQVAAPSGSPLLTGSVSFFQGSTLIGTATVTGGTANLTTNSLPVGTLQITAQYSGDASNNLSNSAPILQQVLPIASSISVTPTTVAPAVGALFRATVTAISPTGGTAANYSGTVTATLVSGPSGGTISGGAAVTFVDGTATFSALSFNKIGRYVIRFRTGNLIQDVTFNVTGGGRGT